MEPDRFTPEVRRTKGARDAAMLTHEAKMMKDARAARSNIVRGRMRR